MKTLQIESVEFDFKIFKQNKTQNDKLIICSLIFFKEMWVLKVSIVF